MAILYRSDSDPLMGPITIIGWAYLQAVIRLDSIEF
jgi:hypothetical protein